MVKARAVMAKATPENIADVLNNAKSGDTLTLIKGEYDRNLIIPSAIANLTIVGDNSAFLRSVIFKL